MITGHTGNGTGRVEAASGADLARQRRSGQMPQQAGPEEPDKTPSRALVATGTPRPESSGRPASHAARSGAAFITQLIASELGLETSRLRRRAAPEIAAAAYVSSAARPQANRPQRTVRSI